MHRRAILKSIGLVTAGAATFSLPEIRVLSARAADDLTLPPRWSNQPLGRISRIYLNARAEPNTESEVVGELRRDDIIRVREAVRGEAFFDHNDLWLRTPTGYVYSSFVQPMYYHLPNTPTADLGEGRWAELTVPFSDAYRFPGGEAEPANEVISRMAYGSTFRVVELVTGPDGLAWYKVQELYQSIYMRATHLRLIDDADLTALSPDVPSDDKWIDIDTAEQILTCYEGDTPVMRALCSTGRVGKGTPWGTYTIWDKRISERMVSPTAADADDPDFYNLPGVPFASYFTSSWVAVHGCYWHNDYGQPRSAGCVNLPGEQARWVWRWSQPHGDLAELYTRPADGASGTRVVVRGT